MTVALAVSLVLAVSPAEWLDGEHATTEWQGARDELTAHGITLDFIYTGEGFVHAQKREATLLGHLDLAVTLDTEKLGLWSGGKFYVLGQASDGTGINTLVGSANEVSNLEARQFSQLGEFFYEQALFDEHLKLRLGKQDANREFGTPRYGGNFINNNFGMYPTTPLPSFPTTGLGAALIVEPAWWLALKAMVFEGSPQAGSLGFDSAFATGAGVMGVAGGSVMHHYGTENKSGGTTSLGVWAHSDGGLGVLLQNDERLYVGDSGGLNFITRFSWSKPEHAAIPLYVGASLAWHGLGFRDDDTVGLGFGYFTLQAGGSELFVEAFYKMRLTHFLSLQPDVQIYRTPGGEGPPALLFGLRAKVKL